MRERLQRRKKKPAAESGEANASTPLQPAYFEAELPQHGRRKKIAL